MLNGHASDDHRESLKIAAGCNAAASIIRAVRLCHVCPRLDLRGMLHPKSLRGDYAQQGNKEESHASILQGHNVLRHQSQAALSSDYGWDFCSFETRLPEESNGGKYAVNEHKPQTEEDGRLRLRCTSTIFSPPLRVMMLVDPRDANYLFLEGRMAQASMYRRVDSISLFKESGIPGWPGQPESSEMKTLVIR